MRQRAMRGRWTVQVAAKMPESAHTWKRRMRQRAMRGMRAVQVAAETPESAHTWQQRASAVGKRRSCDGRPHRAVQNQAFCCTGRPRRTVRCRKWPCGVREARLSIGGCARRWQQEQDDTDCRIGLLSPLTICLLSGWCRPNGGLSGTAALPRPSPVSKAAARPTRKDDRPAAQAA